MGDVALRIIFVKLLDDMTVQQPKFPVKGGMSVRTCGIPTESPKRGGIFAALRHSPMVGADLNVARGRMVDRGVSEADQAPGPSKGDVLKAESLAEVDLTTPLDEEWSVLTGDEDHLY